jgi:hypothetical protein
MWFAWEKDTWVPVDEDQVEHVRSWGFEVREFENSPGHCAKLTTYHYDGNIFDDEAIAREVNRGLEAMSAYMEAF